MTTPAVWSAPQWAAFPATTTPWGAAWMGPLLEPGLVWIAQIAVIVGAVLGALGIRARLGFGLVALGGLLVLGTRQFHGAVQHFHHLWWFAVLLAASPASDALAWGRWRATPGRSLAWGVPVRIAWGILAAIYFFPGLHKVWVQGFTWAGDPLVNLLHWKWAQAWHFTPLTRLDRSPVLLWLGGLAVLVFELGAPLLVLHRFGRLLFVVVASLFHLGTALWFDIRFESLWLCLIVLLPTRSVEGTPPGRALWPAIAVGVVLALGIGTTGVMGRTQAWPFACYPTFEQPVGRWMPTLVVVPEGGDPLDERLLADDGQRFYAEVWGLMGLYDSGEARGLEAFWVRVVQRPGVREALQGSERVTLHRGWRSVDPENSALRLGDALATFQFTR